MRELDILFMEAGDAIDKHNDQMLISFMEGANPPKTDGIVTKIKKLVESVIKKIKDFFEGKKTKDNIDKLEKAIKVNPSLKNQKVKVKDYSKVEKLEKETSAKLNKCKTKEEAEALMNKYDKQRKALLVALPVVTISVAGVLGYLLHGKNKTINNIEGYASDIVKKLEAHDKESNIQKSLSDKKIRELEDENRKLSTSVNEKSEEIKDLKWKNYTLSSNLRILSNNSETILSAMREYGGEAVQRVLKVNDVRNNRNINKNLAKKYKRYQAEKSQISPSEFIKIDSAMSDVKRSKKY